MKISRDEIAAASTKAVIEAKQNGTPLYFGSGFEAGVRYAESKSQESDSLPCVSDSHFTEFCCYVTGHDESTISQMYQDWKRYR